MENPKNNVLVVDDNPQNIQVIANLLTSNGYNVECSTNGEEALIWVLKEKFDLILLDIMMPEMDGYEVCQRIKEIEQLRDLPIIFLTAKDDIESITKGFKCGGVDYITKPFNTEELIARVRTHIELKQSRGRLQNLNQWLREQVDLRTEELNKSNIELRKAKEELEKFDHTKNEFLKMISHEIRTPLNGIVGFTKLFKTADDLESVKLFAGYIESSVSRLERFSIQALEISSLRSIGRKALLMEIISIPFLINKCLEALSFLIKKKRIQIDLKIPSGDFQVEGDPDLSTKCFNNIIENAIRYSPEEETISIILSEDEKSVSCKIVDRGIGFSNLILSKSFELFTVGYEHVDKGTGCGLYHSKLIIDAHLGEISIGNNEDKGAFVILKFPK